MKDLTSIFLKAQLIANDKLTRRLYETLKTMTEKYSYSIDWDSEDGELWGSLFNEGKRVSIFHSSLPIVFIDVDHFQILNDLLEKSDNRYRLIEVYNWDEKLYSLNIELLHGILDWHSSLPTDSFSINDLWFATI